MELHLIRHGQTNWNAERRAQGQSDSILTELGEQQAREVGERLAHIEFDHIYCSSSVRTRQTAELAFGQRNQEIEYRDSLREIFLGPWEGRLYDEIQVEYGDSYKHFWEAPHKFDVEGAESFYDLQNRAMETLDDISENNEHKRVAIVSHGALIKTVLAKIEDVAMEDLWQPPLMHNCAHNMIERVEASRYRIHVYADQPFESLR